MIRRILSITVLSLLCTYANATEITPQTLIGHYDAKGNAGFQSFQIFFLVTSATEFELQRVYPDGHKGEMCNGTYRLSKNFLDITTASTKSFDGVFTCPSDRSKTTSFGIAFGKATLEDLIKGTTVDITTSLAPGMTLSAFVKRN